MSWMAARRTFTRWSPIGLVLLLLAVPAGVNAYLKIGISTNSGVIALTWAAFPIQYFVTSTDAAGVTAQQLQTAVDQSFGEWTSVATASVSSQFVGFTTTGPSSANNQTIIGFESHPELPTVLGSTSWQLDANGHVMAANIFLNTVFPWSVATPGVANRFDVRSIVMHEIGHIFGLGHSALGETQVVTGGRAVLGKAAVMFPIAYSPGSTVDRALEPDDIAGLSDLYPTAAFRTQYGQISGRVTLNGAGVFGAHLWAIDQRTGTKVGAFSLDNSGDFVISGLTPGLYLVRAEPLDDADLDSFFDTSTVVNINFRVAYYPKQVAVPPGGASGAIEIKVVSK